MAPLNLASPISVTVAAHTAHINTTQRGINDQPAHLNYTVPVVPTPTKPMDKRQFMLLTRNPHWFSRTNLIQISVHGFFREGTSEEAVKAVYEGYYSDYTAANTPPVAAMTTSPSIASATESSADTASIASKSSADSVSTSATLNNDAPPDQPEEPANPPPTTPAEAVSAAAKLVQNHGDQNQDEKHVPATALTGTDSEVPQGCKLPTHADMKHDQCAEQRLRSKRRGLFGKAKRFLSRLTGRL